MIRTAFFSLFLIACWLPYYTIGLGKYREALHDRHFFVGLGMVLVSLIPGYIGLWIVNRYVQLDPVLFRILVIATAQLASASVILVVSGYNKVVMVGLVFILVGSIITAFR